MFIRGSQTRKGVKWRMPSPSVTTQISDVHSHTQTHMTDRERKRETVKDTRGLTVLEGAAMVSISSWVTHTLPDGYKGRSPRDRAAAAAGLVVEVR